MKVSFDKYSLIINGDRTLIRSSAFHYFRSPGEKVWYDRLSKIKAAGYNTVDLYFNWAFHCEKENIYDFSGIKDVKKLLDIAQELELYVIARPGPYINGETSGGGIPFWLFNKEDVVLRCRENYEFKYSEKFVFAVKDWYLNIVTILKDYKNIILFQIENEYSSNEEETEYIQELYNIVRDLGIQVPIFHNDAFYAGLYVDIVDIYAVDCYPTVNVSTDWKKNPEQFEILDNIEELIRSYTEKSPLFIAELQSGWFDKINGIGYQKIRDAFEAKHINIVTKTALSQGVTVFNHYLGVGGTSWGDLASDEVYSSYDFAAPVSEEGLLGVNYFKAKEINYFLNAFNLAHTVSVEGKYNLQNNEKIYYKVREDQINKCDWLFIRNLNSDSESISIDNYEFNLKPYDMKILPIGLELMACKINFSSLEIFGAIGLKGKQETIFLIADKDGILEIADYDSFDLDNQPYEIYKGKIILNKFDNEKINTFEFKKDGNTTKIIIIPESFISSSWINENELILGADMLTCNNKYIGIEGKTKEISVITPNENRVKEVSFSCAEEEFPDISIKNWTLTKCLPELDLNYNFAKEKEIKDSFLDCVHNDIYDEFIVYKGNYSGIMEKAEIEAKHNVILFLNGNRAFEYYYNGNDEKISFSLNEELQKDKNEITVLVQNLGFDKGFNKDVNSPRGLLSFESYPQKEISWKIKGINSFDSVSDDGQIIKLSAEFTLPQTENKFCPIALNLVDFPFSNVNIYINNIKIGRFLKEFSPQSSFYIPEAFLVLNNKINLVILPTNTQYQQLHDYNFSKMNVNIKIKSIISLELIDLRKFL